MLDDRVGATDHGPGLPSWSRGMSPAWERSRCSARSAARTNDLDGDERRHTLWPWRQARRRSRRCRCHGQRACPATSVERHERRLVWSL